MKRTILVLCAISALLVAQDAAGQYKLSGVDVLYTFIARGDYDLTVTDAYGLGITQTISLIQFNSIPLVELYPIYEFYPILIDQFYPIIIFQLYPVQ